MPDNRSTEVQRFRKEQGATRIHLLTVNSPFSPSQDRYVLAELPHDAVLFECAKCSPRVSLGYGQLHTIMPEVLRAFLTAVSEAEEAWEQDEAESAPAGLHDGVTVTVEVADSMGYRRTRIIAPPAGSAPARLLNAWISAFPQVRRVMH